MFYPSAWRTDIAVRRIPIIVAKLKRMAASLLSNSRFWLAPPPSPPDFHPDTRELAPSTEAGFNFFSSFFFSDTQTGPGVGVSFTCVFTQR